MFHAIIIEDDPMVAVINSRYLQSDARFVLDGIFENGREALEYLESHPTDLVIADYYMPIMDGLEFLRNLRAGGDHTAVIMITAANTPAEILDVLSNGVLDYIVKPFTSERFQEALEKYIRLSGANSRGERLSQEEIDSILSGKKSLKTEEALVKGIQSQTLELLRNCMEGHAGEYLTSDEISREIGLSRITVRRYLNYMLENGEISSMVDYTTGGRPSLRYSSSGGG